MLRTTAPPMLDGHAEESWFKQLCEDGLLLWTAYLKAHFPAEFAEAVHTSRMDESPAS